MKQKLIPFDNSNQINNNVIKKNKSNLKEKRKGDVKKL